MGFWFGFLCGLLSIPLSILAAVYYFFTYSESYAEKRQEQLEQERQQQKAQELDLDDMPSALYASYLSLRQQQQGGANNGARNTNGNGLPGLGLMPEHLDPQYQFAGWISVKRIPEVDHRIIEPSIKKETKKRDHNKNGQSNNRKGPSTGGLLDEIGQGRGVAGSIGAGAAAQDARFTYLDTQNPHLSLPPCLQARFKDSKYGVIKGTTMFVYENENMTECLGVITLPNYHVSVPGQQKDSHIFSKRNPIWLKYQPNNNHSRHSTAGSDASLSSKDYYLSMVSSVDKEDLYFTLLRCSKLKTNSRSFLREIPKRDSTLFDKSAMNTLIKTIHSNEHQFQAAWLNAMLGRIFLGVYKTPQIKDMVFQKMVDKLSRVRLPNFLNDMRMKSVHLGDGVPLITRPKLLTLKPNGDMIMDMSLLYQGGFRAEVEAEAVVTVTKKIQPIKVSLVLVMTLIRLEGRVQVWMKPPPCNRIWYGFYHKPQVEMKIEPVVSDKHIKSNLIIKAIENKMLEAIAETMVLPNMDDVPFSDSEGVGGIFGEEILPGGETAPAAAVTAQQHQQQHGSKISPPRRSHSPGPRSATINLAETHSSTPRSAIELPSDLRHRTETMSIPELYLSAGSARSHASLGDELMQTNYTYDSQNKVAGNPDDDPMRSGVQRPGLSAETLETPSVRTLHVPGGRGIKVPVESAPRTHSPESTTTSNSNNTNNNRLLHRKGPVSPADPVRGRRGSLDPNISLSYSTASSIGNTPSSAQFPAMDGVRTMEEHWSQYGISEYEPSAPEGGKGSSSKDKKKLKEKLKSSDKDATDKASVHSKDSGDTGSTHTGNTLWTETTGQSSTLFGHSNSSHSTIDTSASKDKFSLSKMFQGFRKKHTKGTHSGSSLQPPNGSGAPGEDEHEADSILEEDDEGENQYGDEPPYGELGPMDMGALPSSGNLSSAYQSHHRKKFESTPNLSSVLYSGDLQPQDSSASDVGVPMLNNAADSARSMQEEYGSLPIKRADSPVPSVYAASLFGVDDPQYSHSTSSSSRGGPPPTAHNHSLMNFSSAFRKLRNRSHGGSGSSKEELSIPPGDLNVALGQHLLQQKQGLAGSEHSSQFSLQHANGYDTPGVNGYPNDSMRRSGESSESPSSHYSNNSLEDEQFPRDANGPFIPVPRSQPELVYTSQARSANGNTRLVTAAPLIVLQKPSPHLGHTEPSSPLYAEGTFADESMSGRASMDDFRLQQGQARPSNNNSNSLNDKLGSPVNTGTRPRRHSINHPPTISPAAYNPTHSHVHVHANGLGVTPASPLRKEFSRDDDESTFSPSMTPSSESSSVAGSGDRSRNNSDTFSMASSTASSSQSTTPKDAQHPQHSSTFRNILSSLGNKNKRKGSVASSLQGPHGGIGQDPYSTVGIVGIVGIVAMGRATAHTTSPDNSDVFSNISGVSEQTIVPPSSSSSSSAEMHGRTSQESSRSLPLRGSLEVGKLEAGLAPLLESPHMAPTQSIMGKAVALDLDHRKEALHARPGYVGEYPTPVRMHSMLNREAAAVRKFINTDLSQPRPEKEKEWDEESRSDVWPSETNDDALPLLNVGLSPSFPKNPETSPFKSNSLPPLKADTTLPEPLPVVVAGQYIPVGMPVETPASEISGFSAELADKVATAIRGAVHLGVEGEDRSGQSHQRSSSGSSNRTMTRCEYDMMMSKGQQDRSAADSNPRVEEPTVEELLQLHQQQQEQQQQSEQHSLEQQGSEIGINGVQDDEPVEDNRFLQATGQPPNSVPGTKKSHHRNIFKRLIRRKSEDSLSSQDPSSPSSKQRQKHLQGGGGGPEGSLYINPVMSQSQSSIMSTSTSSSSRSLPFFHRHHHHQSQDNRQAQQMMMGQGFEPSHPHDHEYQEHTSTQIPERNTDMERPGGPVADVGVGARTRAQSAEEQSAAASASSSSGGGLFSRVRTRPRSSTIHAISPSSSISRR